MWDQRFAEHELLESKLMDDLMRSGMDEAAAYDIAHKQVLQYQGIKWEPGYEGYLYHPDVIAKYSSEFSPAAQELSKKLRGQ